MRNRFCYSMSYTMLLLVVVLSLGGCAGLFTRADPTMVIKHHPWKQRPGTSGAVGPLPTPSPQDTRFKGMSGQFVAELADEDKSAGEDWVIFDGEGNFRCGPGFHPNSEVVRPPHGKGYLQGFYMIDGRMVYLAFSQGDYKKAHAIHNAAKPVVERLQFNDKTYAITSDRPPLPGHAVRGDSDEVH